jgi:hypothetical protein
VYPLQTGYTNFLELATQTQNLFYLAAQSMFFYWLKYTLQELEERIEANKDTLVTGYTANCAGGM